MKFNFLSLFFFLFVIACNKEPLKPQREITSFTLNFQDKEPITYDNSVCEFDNRKSQSQFNYTSTSVSGVPKAYVLFSTYKNTNEQDSTLNQVWINLFVEYYNTQNKFNIDTLKNLLRTEDSNENTNHLYPDIQVEVCGERYDNEDIVTSQGESYYKLNDNFKYKINEYEVLYESNCVERSLLFLDITIEGMLYQHHGTGVKLDSIYLNESNMKLLFDIE